MKPVTLDCSACQTPADLHTALARSLHFPDWYGNNLDALFDCLTECAITLQLTGWALLPDWSAGFAQVFEDAQLENPELSILIA